MQLDHTASSPKLETSTSAPSRELASSRLKAILCNDCARCVSLVE